MVGGFIGYGGGNTSYNSDYWDTLNNSSLPSAGYKPLSPTSNGSGPLTGVTPLTDSQMYESSNFAGFDFTKTWDQINGITYPFLRVFAVTLHIGKASIVLPSSWGGNWESFLRGNINGLYNYKCVSMENCHAVLSPKQSGKLIKEIVKAGGKIGNKVLNNKFNKVFNKVVDDPYFGPILKNVLKKAVPNNGGGPT